LALAARIGEAGGVEATAAGIDHEIAAILLSLDSCQNPSRFKAAQDWPVAAFSE
jgi:hypothetical protein